MNDDVRKSVHAVAFGVLALAAIVYVMNYSRSVDKAYPTRTFTVDGTGEIESTPDVAKFSVTVISEGGNNVSEVQNANTEKMNKINSFFKEQGIDDKDLKTSQYSLNPRYNYVPCPPNATVCQPATISGYTLNQTLDVKVRDTSTVGDLLTGAVANGANSVSDVRYVIDDEDDAKNEARKEAIAKAQAKASQMAKAGGFRIGQLVSIFENQSPQPYGNYGYGGDMTSSMEKQASPTIQPGSQETSVQVSLTYEIVN